MTNQDPSIPRDIDCPGHLGDQLEWVIEQVRQELEKDGQPEGILQTASNMLVRAQKELDFREERLGQLLGQSNRMAREQAEALIRSSEVIEELERTKRNLAEARLAAEEAAEDTQRLADTIFERTNDGVLVFEDTNCIACNDNALELLGGRRDEIVGGWPASFDTARNEEGYAAKDSLRQLFENPQLDDTATLELQLQLQDNRVYWAELTVSAFSMKTRSHVLVVVRDVTARKQFEVELRRHRDFLNNIINAVPDPLSVKTPEQELVIANDAFCEVYGLDREAVLGQSTLELLNATESMLEMQAQHSLLRTGDCQTSEHQFTDAKGKKRVASIKRSIFNDQTTGRQYVVSTSRDITSERQREQQLKMLASVFESATEGAAILQPDGSIVEANPAFLAMANVESLQEISGCHLLDVFPVHGNEIRRVLYAAEFGEAWSGKASMKREAGSNESYWISLSPSHVVEGRSERLIALISDITELENSQQEIRHRALHDPLTDLPNRAYFRELLEESVVDCEQISVCFLDLDDFKHVNDTAGHAAGDELLRQVSKRITRAAGHNSILARFGGDEFALMIRDRSQQEAMDLIHELLQEFRAPFQVEETSAVVGLSIGMTQYPHHAQDADSLLQTADIAMYAAKTAGKNRVRVFETSMQDTVNLRHRVQTKLQDALQDGEISLHFQPKFSAQDRKLVGCESLVRWRNKAGDYIPPSQFIPIAEQTGLIGPLGDLVFQLAAEQACHWADRYLPQRIAVNVSPHQLRHPGFVAETIRTLEETGAKAEWFELEITEHAMMEDLDHAISVVNQLADLGFKIAVDDFGTGYSSLSYLKNFNIHTLKIDISFVREVATDPYSEAIVKSIVSLGSGLGLTVVAEGVEEKIQADLLTEFGCHVLQGFYFGHPVPADQLQDQLETIQP